MKMTRERLGQIIREEAARLQEAAPKKKPRAPLPPKPRSEGGKPVRTRADAAARRPPGQKGFPAEDAENESEIGSYEAVEAGEQLERFSEAVFMYAGLITKGVVASAGNVRARSSMLTLKDELKNVGSKLKELATTWDRLIVGPEDEVEEPQRSRDRGRR